ncbi:acetyl-CoA carboxylase biotin carboxyl carrier protein subunit [Pedobacter metabolipauper]|uniref:Biotin carboxyl carrier protein n=1 Tax=Pedobacter metabolipauper TaxID=425513 RepID=A0A4R6SYQ3_9SPHI|nr:acetyl-CoA carboxylase biotin carboxyl carrier protein subunit [Pedobacter metabolipauper]TDQ09822.1 biotin carboxyl carrier protein [Pedobacter metabolipauper]
MKVKVNETYVFELDVDTNGIKVNDSVIALDSRDLPNGHTHVIYNHKSYNIELVSENRDEKTSVIKVNGNAYTIVIEDQYDLLLKQLGLDNIKSNKIKEIKAPMPGLVIGVLVSEGDEVNQGDNLLVLEAMKMENIIKSPTSGTIKKIGISKGDKVEKNELLIQFV